MEIHFTGAGILVILLIGLIASRVGADLWMATAITATGVGGLHGLIFWIVRRRQRLARLATINSVQGMLMDVVNNQLAILRMANELNQRRPGAVAPERIDHSISQISEAVNSLSSESLQTWQSRYERS